MGNIHGDLAIFKHAHRSMRPWRIHRDLGTITAVAVGDIRNHGRASVVVVTAEGFCYVFDFTNTDLVDDDAAATSSAEGATTGDTTLPSLDDLTSPMGEMPPPLALHAPSLRLPVPVNISRILIADVDRDGQMELLVARTDRVLHAYRLEFTPLSAGVSPVPSSGSPGLMRNSSSVSLPQQARLQSLTVAQQPYAVQRNTRPAASMRQAAPTSGVTHMSATVTANAPRRNMTEPLSVNTSDSASGIVQTPFGVTTIPEESATNATSPKLASVATGLPAPDTVSARGSPGVPERATLVELRMWQFQQQVCGTSHYYGVVSLLGHTSCTTHSSDPWQPE